MADTCKNCVHSRPTYKGIYCESKGKRVKTTGTCEDHRRKN